MRNYLQATQLLDFQEPRVQSLISQMGWRQLSKFDRIGSIYDFVRNEIKFGYNRSDDLTASAVLADGYGQCNTKATLLMALLRGVGVQCRLHGFTIRQDLQAGAIPDFLLKLAPAKILHSWVEVKLDERWLRLEGFILDQQYLEQIKTIFATHEGPFCGYGIATKCLSTLDVSWHGMDTFIQRDGIDDDLGLFDTPDAFYCEFGTNLVGLKRWLYQWVFRHIINMNVIRLRD